MSECGIDPVLVSMLRRSKMRFPVVPGVPEITFPEDMSTDDFANWLDNASAEELESFGNCELI